MRVTIGGQAYNLRSDDEAKVREIALTVDTQFRHIQTATKEQSTATLSMLTALNIAEKEYESRKQQQIDMQYLAAEVEEMIAFVRQTYQGA